MKRLIIFCLLLWGCRAPQYHLYVYYASSCPTCHIFLEKTMPLLQEKYGKQMLITTYDIDEKDAFASYQDICTKLVTNPLKENKGSVPFIVLDGYFAKTGYKVQQQDMLLEAIDDAIHNQSLPSSLDEIYEFKK